MGGEKKMVVMRVEFVSSVERASRMDVSFQLFPRIELESVETRADSFSVLDSRSDYDTAILS